ncbi:aminodeoxychorismate synthase component I [Candidatus Peregrinibacteria bacterium]|nr:aminodeoxychorismate synthase component I [Candidatus Peregrinibacteria bacterium]
MILDIPVIRNFRVTEVETDRSPDELYAPFAKQSYSALLTGKGGTDNSRYSFIGINPLYVHRSSKEPFDEINHLIDHYSVKDYDYPLSLWGGIGLLSYDALHTIESIPHTTRDMYDFPLLTFVFYKDFIVVDHQKQKTYLIQAQTDTTEYTRSALILEAKIPSYTASVSGNTTMIDKKSYVKRVGRIIDYIKKGDVYEVNLSHQCATPFSGDAYALFQSLYTRNPAPFSAYLSFGDSAVLSNSPERFLYARHNYVETRPIKGTAPRFADPKQDAQSKKALLSSEKDAAELAMIVDLLRNDLGKISTIGSVCVKEHRRVEAYRKVWHMLSIITSQLRDTVSYGDLLRACFPGGSITGCPKIRSMEIIDELEDYSRHAYTGSIFIANDKRLDSNIIIRTLIAADNMLYFNVGGAIVYDSVPEKEYQETLDKAANIMAVLNDARH